MVSIDLNNSQRTMLTTLVNRYQQTGEAVTGETIAEEIDRNPGTVRNQMQSLTSLGLVEGIPGPTGGYKPRPRHSTQSTASRSTRLRASSSPATTTGSTSPSRN